MEKTMEKIIALAKSRGFVYPGSEIYGGLANTWDYGNLGVELKNNVKKAWWKKFIQENPYNVGVDCAILMNPQTWVASGHLGSFSDPLMDCKECHERFRADKVIEDFCAEKGITLEESVDAWSQEKMKEFIEEHQSPCPTCGKHNFTDIRQFNLMFATQRGVTNDSANTVYLRPENAQGEYVNFLNVLRTTRTKLPFSIGQIGKAFRNEITPGNFTFRTIEFEQMEFQTFCKHGDDEDIYEYFKNYGIEFFNMLGLPKEKLRHHDHEKLAHYAKAACDIEYLFPFGWGEINGTHNRTDFDLSRHAEFSGKKQEYCDQTTGEKFTPYIIESTYGLDRITLAVLFEAYTIEELENGDTRELLKISPALAPIKLNICPIKKKFHSEKAKEILAMCKKHFMTSYDESGSIGKRYRRADAIGTPWQISVDEKTVEENIVTLRDRDTMEQIELKVEELVPYIEERIQFEK